MSAIPLAITPNPHTNLLNVYIQIANKMGFQPTKNQQTFNVMMCNAWHTCRVLSTTALH
jgi:hypothetical protein